MSLSKMFTIIFLAIAVLASTLILTVDFLEERRQDSIYVLKEDNGIAALYLNEQLVEQYDGIVIANLPVADRQRLESGVEFETIDAARRAVEDYDG